MELITKYFPNLTDEQKTQFEALYDLYLEWNSKINVISRKDICNYMSIMCFTRLVSPSTLSLLLVLPLWIWVQGVVFRVCLWLSSSRR